jgi:hypothetical protein
MSQLPTIQATPILISRRIIQSGEARATIADVWCAVERGLGSSGMGSAIDNRNTNNIGIHPLGGHSVQFHAGFMDGSFVQGDVQGDWQAGLVWKSENSAKYRSGVVWINRQDLSGRDPSVRDLFSSDQPIRYQLGGRLPAQRSGKYKCNFTVLSQV